MQKSRYNWNRSWIHAWKGCKHYF